MGVASATGCETDGETRVANGSAGRSVAAAAVARTVHLGAEHAAHQATASHREGSFSLPDHRRRPVVVAQHAHEPQPAAPTVHAAAASSGAQGKPEQWGGWGHCRLWWGSCATATPAAHPTTPRSAWACSEPALGRSQRPSCLWRYPRTARRSDGHVVACAREQPPSETHARVWRR